jgi:ABC-type transport system involved in multi-copper enzyme maturation permease subunit
MTASISTPAHSAAEGTASLRFLPGFGGLLRKELTEWWRGRRTWVVFAVSALFMTLSALNAWLQANVLPADGSDGVANPIVDPMVNLVNATSSQIFAVAAIFAVMGLLVAERENGTLAWTASKPVSRGGIWLAKLVASSGVLWIVAGVLPLGATVALIVALYGALPAEPILVMAIGTGLSILLYVTVALTASTFVTSQAAVAAIAIGTMFLPQLLGLFVPPQFMPTSILQWTMMVAAGEAAGVVTPLIWAVAIGVLVAVSLRRMGAMEL